MSPVSSDVRVEWSTRLAEALVGGGYAAESDLSPLLAEAELTGRPLATILIERQVATPGVVVGALAQLAQLPAVDLLSAAPEPVDALSTLIGYRVVPMLADPTVIARVLSSGPVRVATESGISGAESDEGDEPAR